MKFLIYLQPILEIFPPPIYFPKKFTIILRKGDFTVYNDYIDLLKSRLDEYRFYHSLCVADEAKRLALKYGGDADKAYLAGLLHDVTKNAPKEEHLQIFTQFGIMLNDIEKNAAKLWHAMSGAAYVKHILNIEDEEIISSIRYHTTAKADMTLLEKIIFLADFTSADRDYDDVSVIRQYVDESLDKAFIYALQYSICDLVNNKKRVHLDTLNAYNQAVGGK
ncbi:MAG: bis(5'-nucleosyl)-tetraphosphatase (symmetrical) YqeK [Clostridia bacterium]|nr:bis(5'-nucleosyl)-tetraphosphatase (symmetrical) YqeK [Clostridia bacterium]